MQLTKKRVEELDISYIHAKATKELELLSNNSVLLTGAGGFLGYYLVLCIAAWNEKHPKKLIRLTALSAFRSGIPDYLRTISDKAGIEIVKRDIISYRVPKNVKYDYIIHAASIASPTFYRKFPIVTINANVKGLYNILEYMVTAKDSKNPVKGTLYFSSSEIYGDPTSGNIPTPETYRGNVSCTGPRACYDESKRFCETLCVNYSQVYDLPIRTARPFNNYGPGLRIGDGRVIPDFANNILRNQDIVMYSDGSPKRTFCYVADAIVGYIKILVRGRNGEAYNIGVEEPETSVLTLAKKMVQIGRENFGYSGRVRMVTSEDKHYLTDNPVRRCPVIDKARKELGYNPTIDLYEGLVRSIAWYQGK